MSKPNLVHLQNFTTVEDILDEARRHNFPASPVRLVSTEPNSWMPVGHTIVKTEEELVRKAVEVMEFSSMLHVMVVPSNDPRFWNTKLLYPKPNNHEYVKL